MYAPQSGPSAIATLASAINPPFRLFGSLLVQYGVVNVSMSFLICALFLLLLNSSTSLDGNNENKIKLVSKILIRIFIFHFSTSCAASFRFS